MNAPEHRPAWLEDASHKKVPIQGSCSIGRSASNQVTVTSESVSRRHAIIQVQREFEYWLVDFGSRNGTYLNDRRIIQPTRLRQHDRIRVGPVEFVFHLPRSPHPKVSETIGAASTVTEISHARCWLLVADIIGSSRLIQETPPEEVPRITGRWVAECKQTIEEHGGRINQFMGDGFFAYWRDRERVEVDVGKTLRALQRLQEQANPAFRIAVHCGEVVIGGFALGEEERISGDQVHFVFRLEKLAGQVDQVRLLSQAAWERLASVLEAREIGRHPLPGFNSDFAMYAF